MRERTGRQYRRNRRAARLLRAIALPSARPPAIVSASRSHHGRAAGALDVDDGVAATQAEQPEQADQA